MHYVVTVAELDGFQEYEHQVSGVLFVVASFLHDAVEKLPPLQQL